VFYLSSSRGVLFILAWNNDCWTLPVERLKRVNKSHSNKKKIRLLTESRILKIFGEFSDFFVLWKNRNGKNNRKVSKIIARRKSTNQDGDGNDERRRKTNEYAHGL
jgi:hypothetical protein